MSAAPIRIDAALDTLSGVFEAYLGKLLHDDRRVAYGEALRVRGAAKRAVAADSAAAAALDAGFAPPAPTTIPWTTPANDHMPAPAAKGRTAARPPQRQVSYAASR